MARVHFLSADSGLGKTTALAAFAQRAMARGESVGGVLGPVGADGLRKLMALRTGEERDLQMVPLTDADAAHREARLKTTDAWSRSTTVSADAAAAAAEQEHGVAVGPFVFDGRVFEWGQAELRRATPPSWIIVDEVGPLEMKRKAGLEPAVGELLRAVAEGACESDVIVVVRPSLRGTIASHFGLPESICDDVSFALKDGYLDPASLAPPHSRGPIPADSSTSAAEALALVAALAVLKLLLVPAYHSTDFEVHRNWLAITASLPIERWYFEDTSEWTLDYPPLFAYMEWCLSWPAALFDPAMLTISATSYASAPTLLYQRLTVIAADCALAYGAAALCTALYPRDGRRRGLGLALTLCNPGLLLVDHVHFQYNGALYALLLLSLAALLRGGGAGGAGPGGALLGGVLFAALLNAKHIFLYFLPPVFVFLLRGHCCCAGPGGEPTAFSPSRFLTLGLSVLLVFALSLGPFVAAGGVAQLPQILARLFPFQRGLCHAYWAPNSWAIYNLADKLGTAL